MFNNIQNVSIGTHNSHIEIKRTECLRRGAEQRAAIELTGVDGGDVVGRQIEPARIGEGRGLRGGEGLLGAQRAKRRGAY